MKCPRSHAIITVECCINRQKLAQDRMAEKSYNESLINCEKCPTGKSVLENPEKFTNDDITKLKELTWKLVIQRKDFAFFRIKRYQLKPSKKITRHKLRKEKA